MSSISLRYLVSASLMMSANAIANPGPNYTDDVVIDLKERVGLVSSETYLIDMNDDPTPGVITAEIHSIQGNKATGPQTVELALSKGSSTAIYVNEQRLEPGAKVTFVADIAEDGRLRVPYRTATNTDSQFSYTLEIKQLQSSNDKVPDLSINDASVTEGDSAFKTVDVTVEMDVMFGKPVTFDYISNDINSASIAGEARNLAFDKFGNPFISIVDNPLGGRLTLDGGFPKFYNQTAGEGDTWRYLTNVYHWLKSDNFGNGILLLGDKPASHGGSYRIKDAASSSGFASSFTTWANNNGVPITIKDVDDFGGFGNANVSLDELKKYKAIFVMGSATAGRGGFTSETVSAFADYSKLGGGIMLITDHDVFQHGVNQIAAAFNLKFYGTVNRSPVLVSDLIAKYGNHELWNGLTVIPAGGSEGNIDVSALDMSSIDYEGVGGTVTFEPGETSITLPIKIFGDTIPEIDESFSIDIQNVKNANLKDGHGVVTILNDD